MKLWDIVKSVGSAVISTAVPGGPLLLSAVNAMLPDDKKLPPTATGSELEQTIQSLPPERRTELMDHEFEIDLTQIKESNSTLRAMLEADFKTPQSTRPRIALGSFRVVAASILLIVSVWAIGALTGNDKLVKVVTDGWPFILAVIAPLVTLLHAYFGVLKREHQNRLTAANGGLPSSGIAGIIRNLIKR